MHCNILVSVTVHPRHQNQETPIFWVSVSFDVGDSPAFIAVTTYSIFAQSSIVL